jgi:hypothetical protein
MTKPIDAFRDYAKAPKMASGVTHVQASQRDKSGTQTKVAIWQVKLEMLVQEHDIIKNI